MNHVDKKQPVRKYPAPGVLVSHHGPTIVFLTVCAQSKRPWLANEICHSTLLNAWEKADAWIVGKYVVMPDHIHLFAAPGAKDIEFDTWVRYWKSLTTKALKNQAHGWQKKSWHHRLRHGESYTEKWDYVVNNPVRKRLVENPSDWPFQGEIHVLPW
jgi:putative transposase